MSDHTYRRRSDDSVEVLLVEDDPGDRRLVREAFEATDSDASLRSVPDGDAALDDLTRRADSESDSLPDLVLVDLNLPGRDGCEVLDAIRADPRLRRLPVIVLTRSDATEDIARSYDADANAYLPKPSDPDGFGSLARSVEKFWVERAQLPPDSR